MKSITDIKVRLIEGLADMIRGRKKYSEEYYEKKYSMYEMELDRLNLLKWVMGIDNWHNDDLSNITLEQKFKPFIERMDMLNNQGDKTIYFGKIDYVSRHVKYLNRLIKEAKSFAEHREKYPDWYDDEGNPIVSKSKQGGA